MNTSNLFYGPMIQFAIFAAVAGIAEKYSSGSATFWVVFALLAAGKLFFILVEAISTAVIWRFEGKPAVIQIILNHLRRHKMPPNEWGWGFEFTTYLNRIEHGFQSRVRPSDNIRYIGSGMAAILEATECVSYSADRRLREALAEVLEIYAKETPQPPSLDDC